MLMTSFGTALVLWTMTARAMFSPKATLPNGLLTQKLLTEHFMEPNQQSMTPDIPPGYDKAYESEAKNWLSNVTTDPFYESPKDREGYAAGSVLRMEKADLQKYTVIPQNTGLSLYRLLYQSLDHNNKPVPASAFILFPYSRVSSTTPLRVIVWAHGTAGIERQCAPSNRRDLYYNWEGPLAMVLRGYAVIAPDYAGLGSNATFHYAASTNHASDIAYAVIATRTVFSSRVISQEWVVVGHSEGGLAAWAANEREFEKPIGGFLGTVALAPATLKLYNLRYGLEHGGLRGSLFYFPYNFIAIARMIESVDSTKFLSNFGIKRARLAATGCYTTAEALYANLTLSDIFKDSSWLDSSWGMDWENKTGITGRKPLAAPLLLIHGLEDTAIYPAITSEVFQQQCNLHSNTRAHLSLYPNLGHEGVLYSSQREMFDWIEARFDNVQVSLGCTNKTIDIDILS